MTYKKGYKAFYKTEQENQGKCKDFVFDEGETYEIQGELKLCESGFHFCKDLVLTFEYYGSNVEIFCFAEVEAVGQIIYEEPNRHKCCTSKIKITRFLSDDEVIEMIGIRSNSGECNSGDSNSGDRNSGHRNSGHRNSGHWNSGHRNSGDWNSGFFNSQSPEQITVFNKPCDRKDWDNSLKPHFIYFDLIEGKTYKESFQEAYKKASKAEIELLKSLPNFDPDVFYEISGIKL